MEFSSKFYKFIVVLGICVSILSLSTALSVSIVENVPMIILLYAHTLIGIFSTLISIAIFISSWFIFYNYKSHSIYFIGLLFLAISVLDIFYTFSYTFGLGFWFWTISRFLGSVGIFLFILKPKLFHFNTRYRSVSILAIVLVGYVGFIVALQELHSFFYNEEYGITSWFIFMAVIIIFFYLLSIVLLIKGIVPKLDTQKIKLVCGLTFLLIGVLFFIVSPTEFSYLHSIIGEAFKSVGYTYLYTSILIPGITELAKGKETAELRLLKLQKEISNQILQAQEEERTLLSRELHDGVGQSLYSVIMTLNAISREESTSKKDEMLKTAKQLVNDSLLEVKELAHSLRPSILDDFGFISAIKSYIKKYKEIYKMEVQLNTNQHNERLHPAIETALFRICQEALTNCAKHAKATQVTITIDINQTEAIIKIQDNGVGFELQRVKDTPTKGIGLLSIRERAEGLGGNAHIKTDLKHGTLIEVRIPQKNNV